MLTYQFEGFNDFWDDFSKLAPYNHEETSCYKEHDPDFDKYLILDFKGNLQVTSARDDGQLIGYSLDFVFWHNQSKNVLTASNDAIYVSPEYRSGLAAYRILEKVREGLKDKGVDIHFLGIRYDDNVTKLLEKFGYGLHEVKYSSDLGEDNVNQ